MKKITFLLLVINSLVFTGYAQELIPPVAAKKIKCDTLFNDVRCDEYHWLRNKSDASVINHLYAENGFSERYMKQHQLLIKKLIEEYRSRLVDKFESPPSRSKGYLYYSRYEAGKDYPAYFRKIDSANAQEVLMLDFQKLSEGYMYFSPSLISVSPDRQLLMYGVDDKGDRLVDVYFKHIDTDSIFADTLRNVSSAIWMGSNAIIYTLPEPKTNRSFKAYKHVLGRPLSEDELFAFEADSTFQLSFSRSSSERFIFMIASKTDVTELSFFDLQQTEKGWQKVSERRKGHSYSFDHVEGNSFLVSTDLNAPNGKLASTPIDKPGIENWKDILPHRKDVLLGSYRLSGKRMAVIEQFDARERLVVYNTDGSKPDTLQLDGDPYTFGLSGYYEPDEPLIRISVGYPARPGETYDLNPLTMEKTFIRRDTIRGKFDASRYVTERVYAQAADGTQVPVTLVYKKGLKKDGNAPVWITGYGAYGNSSLPGFSSTRISLLERGFVHATAHIRGGMDCGRDWYEQGRLLNKMNTFTDMVSCVETLIEQGYTQKGKVVIEGGSAGGLLVGAVLNLRPDLFGAALAEVPFMDVVNTMLDASLPLTTFEYDEWGNPNNPNFYNYMKSYAPYENIGAKNYPPVLATGGYNDSQVPYWEPAKWVARLRNTKTDSNVVLLKINMDAGHGGSSGRFGGLSDLAFTTAFAMQALGIQENFISVKGQTLDSDGNPLPFVNVYVEGTTQATASNENGDFALDINKENNPVLVFSSIGFKKQVIAITMRTNTSDLKVNLPAENYQIKTFEVKADAKDPAYAVMKKAIDKRKFHLNQVDAYSSDIYIKSAVRLDEIPEKLPFFMKNVDMPDSTDLGLIYLSESVAKYHNKKPDFVKEEMIASKIAGMKQGFSWNRVGDVLLNFYNNLVDLSYYSDRGFVSPVSESALFYYKFKMIGTFVENGKTINRIELTPKRKHDPCFRGEIFIVDDTWNIHSVDFKLTKDAQIQFVDTLNIRQEFVEISDSLWMPLTLQFQSRIKIFGFSAQDRSVGVFSNYKINPGFPKGFFGNEVFKIEEKANKVDTTYWSQIRPFTLTEEEQENYRKSDSTETVQTSKPYLDSLDQLNNKLGIGEFLFSGINFSNSFERKSITFNPLIAWASFNAVEGLVLNPEVTAISFPEDGRYRKVSAGVRYGFSDLRWKADASWFKMTNPKRFNWWYVKGGREMMQVNGSQPIQPIVNAAYSLIDKRNLIRLYERTGAELALNRELVNGLMLRLSASYYNRRVPVNRTDYSFSDKEVAYASNTDVYGNFESLNDLESTIATFRVDLSYRIAQKYETRGERKVLLGSKWPVVFASFEKASPDIFGSNIRYSRLEGGLSDNMDVGLLGEFRYRIQAGSFLGSTNASFIDRKHFNGNETFLIRYFNPSLPYDFFFRQSRFNALPYYQRSTFNSFVQIHAEQDFSSWLFNKIPLLRLAGLGTVAGANVLLQTNDLPYTELYVGITNILRVLRVDFVSAYLPGKPLKPLIRFGLNL